MRPTLIKMQGLSWWWGERPEIWAGISESLESLNVCVCLWIQRVRVCACTTSKLLSGSDGGEEEYMGIHVSHVHADLEADRGIVLSLLVWGPLCVCMCLCLCVSSPVTHVQPCCLLDVGTRSQCIHGTEPRETLRSQRAPGSTTFNIRYPVSFKITFKSSLFSLMFEECQD